MHVLVPGDWTVQTGHDLLEQIEDDLRAVVPNSTVFTHLESIDDPEIYDFKADQNIPPKLMSCHTALVDGYFIEGHVPANDILRLLKEKPGHVTGIAVPGMPLGSPGMEHPSPQDFDTIGVLTDGSTYIFEPDAGGDDFSAE